MGAMGAMSAGDDLSVADLEQAMNGVHASSHPSDVCGWDQFNDFHYAVATKDWLPMSDVIGRIEKLGYKYYPGTLTWGPTLFAMAPNGITIQLHNMKAGTYVPSFPPVPGHRGLCDVGPPQCNS